jgi:hypothetical protein
MSSETLQDAFPEPAGSDETCHGRPVGVRFVSNRPTCEKHFGESQILPLVLRIIGMEWSGKRQKGRKD